MFIDFLKALVAGIGAGLGIALVIGLYDKFVK